MDELGGLMDEFENERICIVRPGDHPRSNPKDDQTLAQMSVGALYKRVGSRYLSPAKKS